jgi:FHA domain
MRFAILLVLYLFLGQLVAVIWRDLRRPVPGEVQDARPKAHLVVVEGGGTPLPPGHSFSLVGDCSIGRGTENDVALSDGFVSTSHALLSLLDGRWWLEDLGSRNGSFVNGRRVDEKVSLKPGDQITIGQVKLELAP